MEPLELLRSLHQVASAAGSASSGLVPLRIVFKEIHKAAMSQIGATSACKKTPDKDDEMRKGQRTA
jgi:hypothetical protein